MDRREYMMTQGPGSKPAVSIAECRAMRLLRADGWTVDELGMTFMLGENAARRHIRADCKHSDAD